MVSPLFEKKIFEPTLQQQKNDEECLVSLCGRNGYEVSVSKATFYLAN
jgi:hypothetical protein